MKHLTTLLILSATLLLHPDTIAQTKLDAVYLKDGSIFRGTIVELQPDSIVKIEIAGSSVLAFSFSEIDSLSSSVNWRGEFEQRKNGYCNFSSIGIIPGSNQNYYYTFAVYGNSPGTGFTSQMVNAYRFKKHFITGAGLGVDIYDVILLQPFFDGRWEILSGKQTPFIYADAGYSLPLTKPNATDYYSASIDGAATYGFGTGVRFNFRPSGAFTFDVGYKRERYTLHEDYSYDPGHIDYQYSLNRIVVKVGMAF